MINMLLIRNPISSTKKLFRKTLNSFKSLFSSQSYQKLPKTTMETLNTKRSSSSPSSNSKAMVVSSSSTQTQAQDRDELVHISNTRLQKGKDPIIRYGKGGGNIVIRREERRSFVAQKLRELEMVDAGNIDHKLDIEEVLHYYSRLTCQPYLDLVDTLFVEIYAEFFGPRSIRG